MPIGLVKKLITNKKLRSLGKVLYRCVGYVGSNDHYIYKAKGLDLLHVTLRHTMAVKVTS